MLDLDIDLGARRKGSQRPGFRSTNRFFVIFGRTDFRIGVSGAKFHEETDFDVYNYLAPPKSRKNDEKLISETKKHRTFSESLFRRFGGR